MFTNVELNSIKTNNSQIMKITSVRLLNFKEGSTFNQIFITNFLKIYSFIFGSSLHFVTVINIPKSVRSFCRSLLSVDEKIAT